MAKDEDKLTKRERKRLNKEKGKEQDAKDKTGDSSMMNKLLVVAGVVALAFIGWKLITPGETDPTSPNNQDANGLASSIGAIKDTDYVFRDTESEVVLIEYGDFQCPACGAYYPVLKQLKEEYGDQVSFIHRDLPLRSIHRNAQLSAQAAQAAGLQGKFWEMHDKLYETQEIWSDIRSPQSDFEKYASEIGLDVEQFKNDLKSDSVKQTVNSSYDEAISSGLNSTPSFILNGEAIDNPRGYEAFQVLIDEALENISPDPEASPSGEPVE